MLIKHKYFLVCAACGCAYGLDSKNASRRKIKKLAYDSCKYGHKVKFKDYTIIANFQCDVNILDGGNKQ